MAVLVVAIVVLAQCCNAIVAARLLEADRAAGGGWLLPLIMQVLKGGSPPGATNPCEQNPAHPPPAGSSCVP
ncbi:hypothetical protein BRADI_1g74161v3 [Brachypodium distachyon]|uniref:Uncharacterized protein n=1 Tax=Brachypodium distachyon TaxID=15368 RepID=A0A0Q3LJN9_BRADI|nr:hypothetical protein BRADI_1g74161v3 [Brachypodium distachyon]